MKASHLFTKIFCTALIFNPCISFAQFVPILKPVEVSPTDRRNYVRTWEATAPDSDAQHLLVAPLRQVKQSVTYLDGLGRPLQSVTRQGSLVSASATAADLVTPVVYDAFGRETQRFLPFAATTANGLYKDSVLVSQNRFYTSAASPLFGQGESYFYAATQYEPSPLNRITKALAPGSSWVGAGRGVALASQVNTAGDSVRCWTVTDLPGDFGRYSATGLYPAGSLNKTVTTDEAGKMVVEYRDLLSKTILKKVQATGSPSPGHSGWLCTYYIYDDLDRLRAVLQPLAVEEMNTSASWAPDSTTLQELAFRYDYDRRGRMIRKKVPGAGTVLMVYDLRDRLVMTQDANMGNAAAPTWLVTVYDDLNRPVQTGLWANGQDQGYHAALAGESLHYPLLATGWELLTETHYDDYSGLPAGLTAGLMSSGYETFLGAAGGSPEFAEPLAASTRTKGLVCWTSTKVLNENRFLAAVNIYDEKGRVIQVQSRNYSGGTDITTTRYDFTGKVLATHLSHQKAAGTPPSLQLATRNTYDDLGRLLRVEKNPGNTGWKAILELEYDALGQLIHKKLAPGFGGAPALETLSYDYNIRGWLLGVNRSYLGSSGGAGFRSSLFGFELGYDKAGGFTTPQYNGNISGTIWKSAGDQVRRRYDFAYDAANRFGRADFSQNTDAASDGPYTATGANFSVHGSDSSSQHMMAYDANGNILSMVQHGIAGTSPDVIIDALQYTYNPHSNKLRQVRDDHNDKGSLLGDFKYDPATKKSVDYGYDPNGNLVTDLNRKLQGPTGPDLAAGGAITYNYLNLPSLITVAGSGTIEYVYDATGNKLKKVVHETGKPDRSTLYIGGIVYEDDRLLFCSHEEGRIRPLAGGYTYDYFIRDHLGNVRMVLTEEQQQQAYPAASLEQSTLDSEKVYYRIPGEGSRVSTTNVAGYPQQDNQYVQRLNGRGQRVGTSIVLRVMAGDRVNIRASSWYRQNGAGGGTPSGVLPDVVASLAQGIGGAAAGKAALVSPQQAGSLSAGVAGFLSSRDREAATSSKPKSYLNWLLLDEQLKPVITADGRNSGFDQVGEDQQLKIHEVTQRAMTKNGYLYIYLSNESPDVDVFFDNLQVTHIRGPILEETHYYPFGLTMMGISSKAMGGVENKRGYNGNEFQSKEFSDGSGLDLYDFNARTYDQQIGRFIQIDPLIEEGEQELLTPYQFGRNDPIKYMDPDGKCPLCVIPILIGLLMASDAAVAPTGKAVDGPAIKQAHDDYSTSAVMSLIPFSSEAKVSTTLFGSAKQVIKSGASQAAAKVIKEEIGDVITKETSNAARKEAMRKAGIPTSQQPKSQTKNESGREYTYVIMDGGKEVTKTVQQQTKDASHSIPHWEAGNAKIDERTGAVRYNNYERPKIDNVKVKINYLH